MSDKQVDRRQQQKVEERRQQMMNDSRPANRLATGATAAAAAAAAARGGRGGGDGGVVENVGEADIDKPLHKEDLVRNAVTQNVVVAHPVMNRHDVDGGDDDGDDGVKQKQRALAERKLNENLAPPVPRVIDKSLPSAPQHVLE